MSFIKALIVIPHFIILPFLYIGACFVMLIAWWVVLFTGKYPEGMHKYMVGLLRWAQRICNYIYFMTDKYPPFSMKEDEEPTPAATTTEQ